MTFLHWVAKGVKYSKGQLKRPQNEAQNGEEIHKTPPGQWPEKCQKPSKVAVVLFYMSVIFTMIGTLVTIRTMFYVNDSDSDQQRLFLIGCGLIGLGFVLIVITNCINNRERRNILRYLDGKIEEFQQDENSRAKRNLRNAQLLGNESDSIGTLNPAEQMA